MEKRARSPSQGDTSASASKKRAFDPDTTNETLSAPSNASFQFADPTGTIHQSLRFDDGSIVLKTSGDPPVLFQASKTILTRQSSVFRGMFSLPQPENAECLEGHPLVVVQDEPSELQFFLRAVHFYQEYFADNSWKAPPGVTAVLRLATKYDVLHLRKKMIDYLTTSYYPTSEEQFPLRQPLTPPRDCFQDLRLAKEVGAPCLLPAIYYFCASSITAEQFYHATEDISKAEGYLCDENDKRICLRLRETFLGKLLEILTIAVASDTNRCLSPEMCDREKLRWLRGVTTVPRFRTLVFGNKARSMADEMCAECDMECGHAFSVLEDELWESLPSICGLDSWDILLKPELGDADYD